MSEKGSISISAENMFPIIKKWLYSEKDIFIRELVSNASDAISKLSRLAAVGQASFDEEPRIGVRVDAQAHTISVEDNGIGMTADEVKKYINQVAFSGAKDFFERYKDAGADAQIIGHFGLGFYSAFMVAKRVTIDTLSFAEGSETVRWSSEDGTAFELSPSERTARGSLVTVYLDDDSHEFSDKWKVREVLMKYFRFLPGSIYLSASDDKPDAEAKPVNDPNPLWNKAPGDCTDAEYREFYHKVFADMSDPLFWVHLNIDYPFRLKGILYFPKLRPELAGIEGQVKLYCNQVFVADNLKEVIPEYLLLLKGCIDCPDLPLNVSRSFLQNDGTVSRLSAHITKKVGDRLHGLFNTERETYNKFWDDINPFVKYGCLRDEKFYERVKDALLLKTLDGAYVTVDEYLATLPEPEKPEDKPQEKPGADGQAAEHEKKQVRTIYYVSDPKQQAQYVAMYRANGLSAVVLDQMLDNHFATFLEYKRQDLKFRRIDADVDGLSGEADKAAPGVDPKVVEELLKAVAGKMAVAVRPLREGTAPAVVTLSEEGRRIQEMSRLFGGDENTKDAFPDQLTLVVNENHPLAATLCRLHADGREDDAKLIAEQIFDLARLAQKPLDAADMTKFMERSAKIMELAAK